MHVARGAAAQVLHLGRNAQRAVLQLFVFLQQPHKRFIVAVDAAFRALGIGLGRLGFTRARVRLLPGRSSPFPVISNGLDFVPDIEVWRPKIKG